jgi:hypothetical protein
LTFLYFHAPLYPTADQNLMKEVIENKYTELLQVLMATYPEPVSVNIFNSEQANNMRAGLSRARKEYERIQKFIGEKNFMAGKGFKYELDEEQEGVMHISLTTRETFNFTILPAKPSIGTTSGDKNNTHAAELNNEQSRSGRT